MAQLAAWRCPLAHSGRTAMLTSARASAPRRQRLCVAADALRLSELSTSVSSARSAAQQQHALIAVDPASAATLASQRQSPSVPFIALAAGAVGLFALVINNIRRRGGLDEHTYRYSSTMYLANVMKDVNTVRIDDLTPDQIEAARARRSKERANHRLTLDDVDLPRNHPFATKQRMTEEQVEQSLKNLRATSMRRRNFDAMQEGMGAGGGRGGGMGAPRQR